MPNTNTSLQRTAAFYHSLSKTQTEFSNLAGNELYKSAHSMLSTDIWMDIPPYCLLDTDAYAASDDIIVSMVGSTSSPAFLYPLTKSNYQTWFLDKGTPTTKADGFEPSSGWAKPLIGPADVTNNSGAPSFGYELKMFRQDGTTSISYDNTYYEVDYYSGLIRFQINNTPIDLLNGLGFTFDKTAFESAPDKLAYIQNSATSGPRAIAWLYVGQYLSDMSFTGGTVSGTNTVAGDGMTSSVSGIETTLSIDVDTSKGLTFSSNGQLELSIDNNTIGITGSGQLYSIRISNSIVNQKHTPNTTSGNNSDTWASLNYIPDTISDINVYINGQRQTIGNGVLSEECYFSRDGGVSALTLDSLQVGDVLYWNGVNAFFELNSDDILLITYQKAS